MNIIADNGIWQMTHEPRCGMMAMPRWWIRQRTGSGWDNTSVFFKEREVLARAKEIGLYIPSPT